jgi:hypothetical protein
MRGSTDPDTLETGEWIDSLRAVLHYRGPDRAAFLIEQLTDEAQRAGASAPFTLNTPNVNTIPRSARSARTGTATSSIVSARSSVGTRLRSFCAPTRNRPSWGAISRAKSLFWPTAEG